MAPAPRLLFYRMQNGRRFHHFTSSTWTMDNRARPATMSHCVGERSVSLKASLKNGINNMPPMRSAETAKEINSHGFIPSALTQIGSVLER